MLADLGIIKNFSPTDCSTDAIFQAYKVCPYAHKGHSLKYRIFHNIFHTVFNYMAHTLGTVQIMDVS